MSELAVAGLMGAISRIALLTPGTFSYVDNAVIGIAGGVFGGFITQTIVPNPSTALILVGAVVGQIVYDNFLFDM